MSLSLCVCVCVHGERRGGEREWFDKTGIAAVHKGRMDVSFFPTALYNHALDFFFKKKFVSN